MTDPSANTPATLNAVTKPAGVWRVQTLLDNENLVSEKKEPNRKRVRVGLFDMEVVKENQEVRKASLLHVFSY